MSGSDWKEQGMRKPQFVYVTYIASTPERVFAALTDPEMTRNYWGNHRNRSDWKPDPAGRTKTSTAARSTSSEPWWRTRRRTVWW
jgi:uncharacterized protein YndB with AHSA1/START domain